VYVCHALIFLSDVRNEGKGAQKRVLHLASSQAMVSRAYLWIAMTTNAEIYTQGFEAEANGLCVLEEVFAVSCVSAGRVRGVISKRSRITCEEFLFPSGMRANETWYQWYDRCRTACTILFPLPWMCHPCVKRPNLQGHDLHEPSRQHVHLQQQSHGM
jgi:hypothetical protein